MKIRENFPDRPGGVAPGGRPRGSPTADSILGRADALRELARRSAHDPSLTGIVVEALADDSNRQARLMGTISVAHVGVAELLRAGTSEAAEAVLRLLATWPEPDRGDLLWYLGSEGLTTDGQSISGQRTTRQG